MNESAELEPGSRVYYDDNPGTVVGVSVTPKKIALVYWDNGTHSTVWASDLLTEEEYRNLNGKSEKQLQGAEADLVIFDEAVHFTQTGKLFGPCVWIAAEAAPACDYDPDCPEHGNNNDKEK